MNDWNNFSTLPFCKLSNHSTNINLNVIFLYFWHDIRNDLKILIYVKFQDYSFGIDRARSSASAVLIYTKTKTWSFLNRHIINFSILC